MIRLLVAGVSLVFASAGMADSQVVYKVLRVEPATQAQLIENGDLETLGGDGFLGWKGWELGYEVDDEVVHGGRYSARCSNATADEHRGLTYVLELNQRTPTPIVAECWSRAENVSGGLDGNYSLYLDLIYTDGTPLWGQIAPFKPGTHDWQKRTVTVIPAKPVRSVSVHGIFRARTGTAWFDDFKLWELSLPEGVRQFDGVPVMGPSGESPSVELLGSGLRGILMLRDVANQSDFVAPELSATRLEDGAVVLEGRDEELALTLSVIVRQVAEAIRLDGTVRDLTGKDRAVTVYCSVPLRAEGWTWHDDQRARRQIRAGEKYSNHVPVGVGANGQSARFPLACVSGETDAWALGAPLDVPRLYRFSYDGDWSQLFGAVDLGLCPDTLHFPSSASFSFVLYPVDPTWGYRDALRRYYELFPQCFTKRNKREGIWMPFVDISTVQGWEDFGFQFQEGAPNVAFDEQHGIYSFVYVEPMSHWLAMPPEMERTNERAMSYIRELAARGNVQAQATLNSALEDADGNWLGGITKAPWCDGALYLLNPSPGVMAADPSAPTKFRHDLAIIEGAANQAAGAIAAWRPYDAGYVLAPGEGRDGSTALRLSRGVDDSSMGASQRVALNQTEPRPIIARVWTRAQDISGDPDNNCSLYIDITYNDGTPLWGRVVADPGGTHDWIVLEQRIVPEKPVQSLTYHLLLRRPRTGTIWFDDAYLAEEGTEDNLLTESGFEQEEGGPQVEPFLDGTYIDSFEMAATIPNYRREHFVYAQIPLVYDREGRLCQLTIFNTVEFAREVAGCMWGSGRMMFANATPWTFPWGAPWLDVMGTETNWAPGGRFTQEHGWTDGGNYTPESDAIMNYRRAVCYQRPYLLLQNTVFDLFKPEWVELYMKRCTAYAVFPSFFSHNAADDVYWTRPNLYNRDRDLFRKYIPVISALNAAGWEPVTYAWSDNPRVYVERFGRPDGPLYLTVFNDSREPQSVTITLDRQALQLRAGAVHLEEVLGQTALDAVGDGDVALLTLEVEAEDVLVLRVR